MARFNTKFNSLNSLTAGVGAALVASALATTPVNAAENPFATSELSSGYMLAAHHEEGEKAKGEGKCGEGKCGDKKAKHEGKCGEGKCGDNKGKVKEGSCGEDKAKGMKEGKCGEGKCGS